MSVGGAARGGRELVLRLSAGRFDDVDSLVVALRQGGRELGRFGVPMAELGLGAPTGRYEKRRRQRDPAKEMTLPRFRADEIRALAGRALDDGDVLWLELEPGGGLDQVPWESWLGPLVAAPILRRPHFMTDPQPDGDGLDVVICASMPESKAPFPLPELIERSVNETRDAGLDAAFHVFVDEQFTSWLRGRDVPGVEVYPAASAGSEDRYEKGAGGNPWLHWMLGSLPPGGVDLVYFICHGFLADGEGALAFAESPLFDESSHRACFAGSRELASFLDRAGAVGLGLASPPENYSVSGLCALADQVAQERPGPVLMHDLEMGEAGDFGRALVFLFGKEASSPPDGVTVYCHPNLLRRRAPAATLGPRMRGGDMSFSPPVYESIESSRDSYAELFDSLSLSVPGGTRGGGPKTRSSKGPDGPPKWLSSSRRGLERHAAELRRMGESDSERGQATRKGKAEALKFVSDLLKSNLEGDS